MAKKERSSEATVTRISASDTKSVKPSEKPAAKKSVATKKAKPAGEERKRGIIGRFFGYFSGAWYELKQVRWPTRGATWGLTAAVLGFSAFFVVFILLLDAGFKYLFEQLLK